MRSLFLILAGAWGARATLQSGKYCFEGCLYTLGCVTFNDTSPALSRKIRACKSTLRAASLFLCIHNYCNEDGRTEWLNGQNGTCQKTTGLGLPPYDIIAEYLEDVGSVRKLTAEEGFCDGNAVMLGEVTIPDDSYFERAFRTLVGSLSALLLQFLTYLRKQRLMSRTFIGYMRECSLITHVVTLC
jgi:hypothetical protein